MIFSVSRSHIDSKLARKPRQKNFWGMTESLERRDVPAIVSWVGSAGTNNWADAANWSGGTLPTSADQVVIPLDPAKGAAADPISITSPVVLSGITTDRVVSMSGDNASLRLTSGISNFNAGLDLNYAGLAVQGAGTVLNVTGAPIQPKDGTILALRGGQINWSGASLLAGINIYLDAGSSINMPDLTSITNFSGITNQSGSFNAPGLKALNYSRLSVLDGAKVDVTALADASNSLLEVDGTGSALAVPNLQTFYAGRFRLDHSGTVTANTLQTVNIAPATAWTFSWYIGKDSVLNIPQVTAINALPQPSPNEAPDARIQVVGNGRIELDPKKWTTTTGQVSLNLAGDSVVNGSFNFGASTVLAGSGLIGGSVNNYGTVSPSGDYSPYGTISVKGDWTNQANSSINLQMGGPKKLDRIWVTGQATILGGKLNIQLADEFKSDPKLMPVGSFQLMAWAGWGGQFASTPDFLPRADGTQYTAQTRYQPNGLFEATAQFSTNPDVISVSNTTVQKGTASISYGIFTINRKGPMTVPITVTYQVIDGTAKSGTNYSFPAGPITLAPGETQRQIRFIIRGTAGYVGDKAFQVLLTSVSDRGVIGQASATVTIQDTNPKPVPVPVPTQTTTTTPKVTAAAKPKTVLPKVVAKPKVVVAKK